jgi:hypothetical protein
MAMFFQFSTGMTMTTKKKESFERKKPLTWVEEQGRWEYCFEQGSRVSRIGLWVKKKINS